MSGPLGLQVGTGSGLSVFTETRPGSHAVLLRRREVPRDSRTSETRAPVSDDESGVSVGKGGTGCGDRYLGSPVNEAPVVSSVLVVATRGPRLGTGAGPTVPGSPDEVTSITGPVGRRDRSQGGSPLSSWSSRNLGSRCTVVVGRNL